MYRLKSESILIARPVTSGLGQAVPTANRLRAVGAQGQAASSSRCRLVSKKPAVGSPHWTHKNPS